MFSFDLGDFIMKEAREQFWEIRQWEETRQMSKFRLIEEIVVQTIVYF